MMTSEVFINPKRRIGTVDPNIYGQFAEHMFDTIYGGVFDPDSPNSDEQGFRLDVIDALKEMKVPVIRWPGGNFVSTYHWRDGIGPRSSRPRKIDPNWSRLPSTGLAAAGEKVIEESNEFGTEEFLELCRRVGATPYINVSTGTAGLDEALEWLEYCNYDGNTDMANLRRRNGHSRPHAVPFWGVGNETWGFWQAGHTDAATYAEQLRQYAFFMKRIDPTIKILGVGHIDPAWNHAVLERAGHLIDYLTIHIYAHSHHLMGHDDYYPNVGAPLVFEHYLHVVSAQIKEASVRHGWSHPIYISVDEWNLRHYTKGPDGGIEVDRHNPRTVMDALFVAGVYHAFLRYADSVKMSNYVMMTNLNAPLLVSKDSVLKTPVFDVMKLFRTVHQEQSIDCFVTSESRRARPKVDGVSPEIDVPYVDGAATQSGDGRKIVLSLINRHMSETVETNVHIVDGSVIDPKVTVHRLSGKSPLEANTFETPDAIRAKSEQTEWGGRIQLPPHSLTLLELTVNSGPQGR